MSNILLAAFFTLFALTSLIETKIEPWVLGVSALAVALSLVKTILDKK